MKVIDTELSQVKIVELARFADSRGFFTERYNQEKLKSQGLEIDILQTNHSRSYPNVIRGIHFQTDPEQGKLVGAMSGRIWDVAVDLRPNSKTFGRHFGLELTAENGRCLWVPPGFGHGFCVLGNEPADILYFVTAAWNPKMENGIKYDDKDLGIPWPVKAPIVSDKDLVLQDFKTFKQKLGMTKP